MELEYCRRAITVLMSKGCEQGRRTDFERVSGENSHDWLPAFGLFNLLNTYYFLFPVDNDEMERTRLTLGGKEWMQWIILFGQLEWMVI